MIHFKFAGISNLSDMIKIKEGFRGERLLSLPDDILRSYSRHPLIGSLYVRKIGFFPKVKYHYVQKNKGADYLMLIYCTAGKGWYEIGDKRYEVNANQFIILPKGVPYAFGANDNDPWSSYWIHFDGNLAEEFLSSTNVPSSIIPGKSSRLQDRLELFEEVYSNYSLDYIKEYMIQTSMCLYPLLSSFLYIEQFRHYKLAFVQEHSFSMQVIYYMKENIGNNLTLEQLATNFNYSSSHFSALFQKETGVSPINYYIQLKIQRACQYIELTNLKLFEIAEKVGFDEPAYFTRIFTKIRGISPSEYRAKEVLKEIREEN